MLLAQSSVPGVLLPNLPLLGPILPGQVISLTLLGPLTCWSESWDVISSSGYFHLHNLLFSAEAVRASLDTVNVMQCCETNLSSKGH